MKPPSNAALIFKLLNNFDLGSEEQLVERDYKNTTQSPKDKWGSYLWRKVNDGDTFLMGRVLQSEGPVRTSQEFSRSEKCPGRNELCCSRYLEKKKT